MGGGGRPRPPAHGVRAHHGATVQVTAQLGAAKIVHPRAWMPGPNTQQDHERLLVALEAARMGTWEWVIPTGQVLWSRTLEEIHGFTPGSFGGSFDVYQSYIHQADRAGVLAAIQRSIETGEDYNAEYRMNQPDGTIHWVAAHARVLKDSEGQAERMIGVCRDVTERHRRERQLAVQYQVAQILATAEDFDTASEQLLKAIVEHTRTDLGELWLIESEKKISMVKHWTAIAELKSFVDFSYRLKLQRGEGLPGLTWAQRKAMWELDLAASRHPRAGVATAAGLHSAFAFPLQIAGRILGVMVFYARFLEKTDEEFLHLLTVLGVQIGNFIERREGFAAVHANERKYRALAETATDAILTIDERSRIVFANPAAERLFGFSSEELLDRTLTDLMPPRFRARHTQGMRNYFATGERRIPWTGVELPGLRKDGTEVPLEISFSEYVDKERFVTGIARDVGARKRQTEALRLLSEIGGIVGVSLDYEKTLPGAANALIPVLGDWAIIDLLHDDGTFRRVAIAHSNPECTAMAWELERKFPSDATGAGEVALTNESRIAQTQDEVLQWMARSEEHADGLRALGFQCAVSIPLTARGRNLGALTLASTSQSRPFGEEGIALAEETARRIAVAIDNARLYENSLEASRARDEFLATISHELKTPITSVLGFTQLLKQDNLSDEEIQIALESIEASAKSQARLVEDILDMSRAIMGKFRLDVSPTHLATVVDQAVEAVRPAATAKGLELAANLESTRCLVLGDPSRLQQVVWNLLTNAIKFTSPGGRVDIGLECQENMLILTVRDSGAGIPPEVLPQVFDRFWQGQSAREHGGLGLGLSIVRHLVELHGGSVRADSEGVGKGSTFTVRLPMLVEEQVSKEALATSSSSPRELP
jgi:PAS domain S-box-containing protein